MIAVIDYGVGNLFSLVSSLKCIGAETLVTSDIGIIRGASKIILPGVGAFSDAKKKLCDKGLDEVLRNEAREGKPIMGICLGMQLLFEKSYEYGVHDGLGLIEGEVVGMSGRLPEELKIPHIGWNPLIFTDKKSILFKDVKEGECVYFVHSYFADKCESSVIAFAEYGINLTAAVEKDNVCGCQFHPEKSGKTGLKILKSFAGTEAGL